MRKVFWGLLMIALAVPSRTFAQELSAPATHFVDAARAATTAPTHHYTWASRHPVLTGTLVGAEIGAVGGVGMCSGDPHPVKCRLLFPPVMAGIIAPFGALVGWMFFR